MPQTHKQPRLHLANLFAPWSEKFVPTKAINRIDLELEPNMRAIRLTVHIAEQLLALGVDSNTVLMTALDITETYCQQRVFFDIGYNSIIASQGRGVSREPLTIYYFVKKRDTNNRIVQHLLSLRDDIIDGLPLYKAEERFDEIMARPKYNAHWLRALAHAGVSIGVVMLYTASPAALFATGVVSALVYWLMVALRHYRYPNFFIQIAAAALIIAGASSVYWLGDYGIGVLPNINGSLIAVGGIVMLVAGMSLTTTVQDAIDEFYSIAAARLVHTMMMTVGIVIGAVGSYAVVSALTSTAVTVPTLGFALGPIGFQLIGTGIIAACWAIYSNSSRGTVGWAALLAVIGWIVFSATSWLGPVAASGISALFIGLAGAIIARHNRSPANAIVNAAIIILVPGVTLFRSFLYFVGDGSDASLLDGAALLVTAIGIALSVATGASFGNYIGRPIRSRLKRLRDYVPQTGRKKPATK